MKKLIILFLLFISNLSFGYRFTVKVRPVCIVTDGNIKIFDINGNLCAEADGNISTERGVTFNLTFEGQGFVLLTIRYGGEYEDQLISYYFSSATSPLILELYKVHIDSIGSGVWLYSFAILTDPHVPTKRIYWCTPWPH